MVHSVDGEHKNFYKYIDTESNSGDTFLKTSSLKTDVTPDLLKNSFLNYSFFGKVYLDFDAVSYDTIMYVFLRY